MFGQLPVELWEYNASDILRGISAKLDPNRSDQKLNIQGIGDCIPTRSGRAAMIIALKVLNLAPGAHIGVPLYCCPVVFKAIKVAGYVPLFIDSDPTTFCLSIEDLYTKKAHLDAVIAVHMYGNVCDMIAIQKVMNRKPVIEDCAQSLGSYIDGRRAGSFGALAVFSFRLGKYLSAGEGGALFSKDPNLSSEMSRLAAALPVSNRFEELKHVLENFIRAKLRSKPLWGVAGSLIWRVYNKNVDFIEKSPIIKRQIFQSDLAIIRNRLCLLDSIVKKQRANADYYMRYLQLDQSLLPIEKPGIYYNRYMFPISFRSSGECDKMAAYLQSHQISSSKPYEEVIEGAAKHYGYAGDCSIAEQLLRTTLVIPCHHNLKQKDIHHIADCVNAGWARIISRRRRD